MAINVTARKDISLSESRLDDSIKLAEAALGCIDDPDAQVRLQLAYSLGEWQDDRAAEALADLTRAEKENPYILAAI